MKANVRIVKEAREVIPILCGVAAAIVLPHLVWGTNAQSFAYFVFALGCVMIAALAFGNEVHHRTISVLLAQPVPRGLLWREKITISAAAIAAALGIVLVCGLIWQTKESFDARTAVGLLLVAVCAWCGAPYWTLLARNAIVGIALAITMPGTILAMGALILAMVGRKYPQVLENEALSFYGALLLLLLYSLWACRRGFVYFSKFEVLEVSSRELVLPARVDIASSRLFSVFSGRLTGPFGALLKKEFRLQQTTFFVAGLFYVFALAGLALCPIYRDAAEVIRAIDFSVYLILVPFLAGALAVAEEQGWGVVDWQLALPPSAKKQWLAKMLVALPTSLFLGLALPFIALCLAAGIGVSAPLANIKGQFLDFLFTASLLALGHLTLTSAAAYAASISSNSLRAILKGMGISIALLACVVWAGSIFVRHILSHVLVVHLFLRSLDSATAVFYLWSMVVLGCFLLLWLFQRFAFSNFQLRGPRTASVWFQLLALLSLAGFFGIFIAAFSR
jgi:hypothetical protein